MELNGEPEKLIPLLCPLISDVRSSLRTKARILYLYLYLAGPMPVFMYWRNSGNVSWKNFVFVE